MPDPLVIGNWKMNGSRASAGALADDLVVVLDKCAIEVAVCPPLVFLADVASCIEGGDIRLGAQNVCEFENGAYTGEVSGHMLSEFGCRYALVGHSERRQWYGESDEQVAGKFVAARKAGLMPVLCVGETAVEHEQGRSVEVVLRQLRAVADKAGMTALVAAAVAYEPVWAIGTGKVATAESAQQVLAEVRLALGKEGGSTRLLYGGSVTAENAAQLFAQKDINGALVGGASLNAEKFAAICYLAERN